MWGQEKRDAREDDQGVDDVVLGRLRALLKVVETPPSLVFDDSVADGCRDAEAHEDDEVHDDVEVGLDLDLAPLGLVEKTGTLVSADERDLKATLRTYRSFTPVHHDLGVLASEENETDDPVTVSDRATSQKELVDGDRLDLVLPGRSYRGAGQVSRCWSQWSSVRRKIASRVLEDSVEGVQVGRRRLGIDHEAGMLDVLLRVDVGRALEGLSDFEIGLSVQVLGLDVADAVRVSSRQDRNVCRHLLVVAEEHDVSDLELLPVEQERA